MGCGHSGTTILRKILSNHNNIFGINFETNVFSKSETKILESLSKFNQQRNSSNKKWLLEKTPKHVYHIDKIYKHVKNPKIIILTRDGRDAIASLNKRYGNLDFSINRWINDNNVWLRHSKIKNFHVLKYEDFVNDPKLQLEKICNFINEPYYDEILNYEQKEISLPENFFDGLISDNHKNDKHKKLRDYQINKPIYDGTKRYINDLSEKDLNLLNNNNKFIDTIKMLGYNVT